MAEFELILKVTKSFLKTCLNDQPGNKSIFFIEDFLAIALKGGLTLPPTHSSPLIKLIKKFIQNRLNVS